METTLSFDRPLGDAGRQRPEELDAFAVVVDAVGRGCEGEGLLGVGGGEGQARGHAGVVGGRGAALVRLLDEYRDAPLGGRAEGDLHRDAAAASASR